MCHLTFRRISCRWYASINSCLFRAHPIALIGTSESQEGVISFTCCCVFGLCLSSNSSRHCCRQAEVQSMQSFFKNIFGGNLLGNFSRASLGKFGQNSFAPPTICLLLHLCAWASGRGGGQNGQLPPWNVGLRTKNFWKA